ncbi:interferon-induced protein 35 [Carcharodon carcharias]|uniref:interferon-induced protein 35 n=1 Tax=Carcharodon carcharias TaxID=13397 RepID=UPI001B7F07F2|nr:interferon-induced protein 35 [Carcharodon carcharias]XP_041029182.1 interferon-induced protein 35 [Carcharodon carcharias]XP_041029183.1 interferon-induced protein 35 [Carcharodon carcharias]
MHFNMEDVQELGNRSLDGASKLKTIQQEIETCKADLGSLKKDIDDLERIKHELQHMTMEYAVRSERLQQRIESDKLEKDKQDLNLQKQMDDTVVENDNLIKEQNKVNEELARLEEEKSELEKQLKVSASMPQQQWTFNGNIEQDGKPGVKFDGKPYIRYPIRGGSAVITFEDETVASKILDMEDHEVEVGECQLKIKAHPLKLPMLGDVEIQTRVYKYRILVSQIPKLIPAEQLLDKLELHFSKQRNSGGEVANVEMLEDSGNVVITFVAEGISENLTKKEFHQVELRGMNKSIPLKISPFVMGEIVNITIGEVVSKKSILFTGIPDVMDEEILQDVLEIYFQKPSNGGGEVDAFAYVPEGKSGIACFEADNGNEE